MTDQLEVDKRFKHLPMAFKTHYKGSFSYRGEGLNVTISAGLAYESYSDAAYHQVDTDRPPEFGSVDDWNWVKVIDKMTGEILFESKDVRW